MKRTWILFLCLLIGACASLPEQAKIEWPERLQYMEASGELQMSWRKVDFSGSVALKMDYPDTFVLEIYGMFGQTIAYLKKEHGNFLLVAGDDKTTDERVFEERYGLRLQQFIDDLAMKGERKQVNGAVVIERADYSVIYGQDRRGRREISWKGPDGAMSLVFTHVSFTQGDSNGQDRGGKL